MRIDLIIHASYLLLHLLDLSVQLSYVLLILLSHACFTGTSLLQNKISVLNMLELLGLGLLLVSSVLAAIVFYLRPFGFHHFNLIKRDFQLLVKRVDVHKVLI